LRISTRLSAPRRVAATTIGVLLAVTGLNVTPALASCDPGRAHDNAARYTITAKGVTGLTGIASSILEVNPYYSGMNDTGTNATVMLLRRSPTTQWAQLGWFKSQIQQGGVTARQVGLEFYVSANDNRFSFWPGKAVGSTTKYMIRYSSGNYYNFYVAGAVVSTHNGIGAPTEYQMFGETHDLGDQMPGGTNLKETFTTSRYYTGSTYTSHVMTSGISSQSHFGTSTTGTGSYSAWDKACAT
jgi:hypothetical protein